MPYRTRTTGWAPMGGGPGRMQSQIPINKRVFKCDVCGSERFERNSKFRATWQRCKKCGTEYTARKPGKKWERKP